MPPVAPGAAWSTAVTLLVALPRPLASAVETELPAAQEALVALQDSKRALATEVASLLGLTLTFSESDGDA